MTSRNVVVIYPGRFQPVHIGHAQVYGYLTDEFDDVYIATSDKVEQPKSPFSFDEKKTMMEFVGIPSDRIVQSKSPYRAQEILEKYDLDNTVALFAVSKKDMQEDPRFSFEPKKDGSPGYFQPYEDNKKLKPASQHGYIITVPTFGFAVQGEPMKSATELREKFGKADDESQKSIIKDMYGKYSKEIHKIMRKLNRVDENAAWQQWTKALNQLPPNDRLQVPDKGDDIFGRQVFGGNKGILVDQYKRLKKVVADLQKLDKQKPLDPDVRALIAKQIHQIIDALDFDELKQISESVEQEEEKVINDFADYVCGKLDIEKPTLNLIRDVEHAVSNKSFGGYMAGNIDVMIGNRHIMDVLRTLAHELVHHKQGVNGELKPNSGDDGSDEENEANARAAVFMRKWAKQKPELFGMKPLVTEDVDAADFKRLDAFVDRLFGVYGIDVEFTRHFKERVNDPRNKKPITVQELARLFQLEQRRWGRPIAQMGPDAQAVMKDLMTDINVPFVLDWNNRDQELELIAKTAMRKPDFRSRDREFPVKETEQKLSEQYQVFKEISTLKSMSKDYPASSAKQDLMSARKNYPVEGKFKKGQYVMYHFGPDRHPEFYITDTKTKMVIGVVALESYASAEPDVDAFLASSTYVTNEYQGKGYGPWMYHWILEATGFMLMSDETQSLGAQKLWKKLAAMPDVQVYAYYPNYRDGDDAAEFDPVEPDEITDRLTGFRDDPYEMDEDEYFTQMKELEDEYAELQELVRNNDHPDQDRIKQRMLKLKQVMKTIQMQFRESEDARLVAVHKSQLEEAAGVGKITKQNTTADVKSGETERQAKKLHLMTGKKPKELHKKARKNTDPNTLFNLGLNESELNEGISDVLFHSTIPYNVVNILEQDRFRLTPDIGTDVEQEYRKKDNVFYLSTSRSAQGDYHAPVSEYDVGKSLIVLDGAQMKRDGLTGKAVDYWGPQRHKAVKYWKDEMEDRIFSRKPYIDNATKYIKSIHIFVPKDNKADKRAKFARRALLLAKARGIPAFLYNDAKAFETLNTRKATARAKDLNVEKDKLPFPDSDIEVKPGGRGTWSSSNYFKPWMELLLSPKDKNLSKRARDLKNMTTGPEMYRTDAIRSLSSDIHNARKGPGRNDFDKFYGVMKKLGLKSVKDVVNYIADKYAREEVNEAENTMTGYKVMRYDPRTMRIISGADRRLAFDLDIGTTISMPGQGVYMTLDPEYAKTYYSGLADNEVLLTLQFDPNKLLTGNLTDRETEFSTAQAKIVDYEILESDEDFDESLMEAWNKNKAELLEDQKVIAYHGTGAEFDKFDDEFAMGTLTWFVDNKDLILKGEVGASTHGYIIKAALDIQNPAGWDEYDKYGTDELIAQGYDGLRLPEDDHVVWVTFSDKQIKILDRQKVKGNMNEADEMEHGTYSALYMTEECADRLVEWCEQNGIEHQPAEEMHCTLIFSKTPVPELKEFDQRPVDCKAKIKGWKKLGNALVFELDFPEAERLNELMTKAGATSDFPTYICHTTVNPEHDSDELPTEVPDFDLEYNRTVVKGIEPDRIEKVNERGSITVPFASGGSASVFAHRPLKIKKPTKGKLSYDENSTTKKRNKRGEVQ